MPVYVRNSPSLLAKTKSFGPINDLPVVRCCTQRDFFHSSRVVFSMLGIGTSRTLAAVLVSEITVRWSTILPSELRTGNSVTAESIEMMPLSKSTFFHFNASASPMRNLESKIENIKDSYYDALAKSDANWYTGENDSTPFIKYALGTVLAAYRDFEERMTAVEGKYASMDLVQIAVGNMIGKFTKNDVMERVPSIGKTSVENALRVLLEEGVIGREGKGKATFYFRKN